MIQAIQDLASNLQLIANVIYYTFEYMLSLVSIDITTIQINFVIFSDTAMFTMYLDELLQIIIYGVVWVVTVKLIFRFFKWTFRLPVRMFRG